MKFIFDLSIWASGTNLTLRTQNRAAIEADLLRSKALTRGWSWESNV